MALPEFQRGYVWNRNQVRGLFDSLYRRHPIGSLLVWATESKTADHRGDGQLPAGVVKLLLDGQQRMTSLYGVVRGKPPEFFDGDTKAFTDLCFHLDDETFEFYQPVKMKGDPLWIDVTDLMKNGQTGHQNLIDSLTKQPEVSGGVAKYSSRISHILGILEIDLHTEEVTGEDKTLDTVVDIFNRVNSGGTKLSKGDLALAKICAEWPEGRDAMKTKIEEWASKGYQFNLDWLLRSVNTVLTGEAKFHHLHEKNATEIQGALTRAIKCIDTCLDMISGRLGLDHDRVFFGRFGIPVMVRHLDQRERKGLGQMNEKERDNLLFWYVQAAMRGRFSGSVESFIDKDLEAISSDDGDLDALIEQLRLWSGGLKAEAGHFASWGLGARFYPVLYLLTRMGEARDWGTGLPLKSDLLGKMNRLEMHHIFPKAQLYKAENYNFRKPEVNALANFCFLTKETNLDIRDRLPEEYFPEVENAHPGSLDSQWIPSDPVLWTLDRYLDFLAARRELLAAELNQRMESLLHGNTHWLEGKATPQAEAEIIAGGISSEDEEAELEGLNEWVASLGLPEGVMSYDHADRESGKQVAVFDLAWPQGLQKELSVPVAVLLNEETATISIASQAGFLCFTDAQSFKEYVQSLCDA